MKGCEVHGFTRLMTTRKCILPSSRACEVLEGFVAPVMTNPGTGLWSW